MRSRPETAAEAKQRHRLGSVTLGRVTLGRATLGRATLGSRTCRWGRPKTQRLPILEVGAPVTTYPQARGQVSTLRQRRTDRDIERADALDLARDVVAGDGSGDARRRSRHDDVAGRQLDHLRKLRHDLRYVTDHLIEVAVLAHLAVDLEHDAAFRRVADFGRGLQRPARRRMIERLADLPRPLDVARSDLQITARQVDADAIAVAAGKRILGLALGS